MSLMSDFTASVKSVQDKQNSDISLAFVVSPMVAAVGDSPGSPLVVEETMGSSALINVYKTLSSYDATQAQAGDTVILIRTNAQRWVVIGKVD